MTQRKIRKVNKRKAGLNLRQKRVMTTGKGLVYDAGMNTHTNRLINETSPYLRQHAHNPVDWHPWGEEAFAEARARNVPVFLSIGYAACHWCHVMERESFENESVAAFLKAHFVSIKVDREERPDLDDVYMQAVQLMTGQGGWPMSVFLTPEGKPFYGGTYFPPRSMQGRIGFLELLTELDRIYREEPAKILENGEALTGAILSNCPQPEGEGEVGREALEGARSDLMRRYDATYGGFGGSPKFPPWAGLRLLLDHFAATRDARCGEIVRFTLLKMAQGGIYDQVGGGFHRYSVDAYWLVPHFEKMLYDNALLAPLYFDAARLLGEPYFERIGRETLDYVLREMTDGAGGFYSTQDADSEGVEGKYTTWRPEEIEGLLGAEEAALFNAFYDISPRGNWHEAHEGGSIANMPLELEAFCAARRLDAAETQRRLDASRAKLLEARVKRIPPLLDDKVLTAWNGLMISAMACGAQATGEARYREAAERSVAFVLREMRDGEGGLLRVWRGGKAKIGAFLEDYANLLNGMIELYQTNFDAGLLREARALAGVMIERFHDAEGGGFFTADGRDATLILRAKEFYDGATPSGNAAAVHALLRLGVIFDDARLRGLGRETIRLLREQIERMPGGFQHMLAALEFDTAPPLEVVIAGELEDARTQGLIAAVRRTAMGPRVLLHAAGDGTAEEGIALLEGKTTMGGVPTVYICRDKVCKAPVVWSEGLTTLESGFP